MGNQTVTVEFRDESGTIYGGVLSVGQGICHFAPRVSRDDLFYPYVDNTQVSAVLKFISPDWYVEINRDLLVPLSSHNGKLFVGTPSSGMGRYLIPMVKGAPVQSATAAQGKRCGFVIGR